MEQYKIVTIKERLLINMKQVNNGYAEYYYMLENGTIYNAAADSIIKPDKRHTFRLRTIDNRIKRVA